MVFKRNNNKLDFVEMSFVDGVYAEDYCGIFPPAQSVEISFLV